MAFYKFNSLSGNWDADRPNFLCNSMKLERVRNVKRWAVKTQVFIPKDAPLLFLEMDPDTPGFGVFLYLDTIVLIAIEYVNNFELQE